MRRSPHHRGCLTILSEEVASMVDHRSLLVTLVLLVDRIPAPPPARRGRGAPRFYPDHLFLKALVIMIVRHLHTVHELLAVLEQPTAEMRTLRTWLTHDGRFPARRTFERRLSAAWRPCRTPCPPSSAAWAG